MKNEDHLVEELIKEHARLGTGIDEELLKEIDDQLESGTPLVSKAHSVPSAGNRWALGIGVAACLALTIGGITYWKQNAEPKDIIAYQDTSSIYSEEKPAEYSSLESPELGSKPSLSKGPESLPGVVHPVQGKGAEPTSDMGKVVVASPAALPNVPVPDLEDMEPSVAFGGGDDFGEGWGSGEGAGEAVAKRRLASPSHGPLAKMRKPQLAEAGFGRAERHSLRGDAGREQYGQLLENSFKAPVDERSALSTFAVDVDTASYANVRRMINENSRIPKDAVRIEEMVNYFDYQYPQPKAQHPFSVNVDSAACPWNEKHRIVRIGVQGKEIVRKERPATNLVFLLDVSGSMSSPNKLPLLKRSMKFLLEELNEQDTVSIVVYAGASGLVLPATKMDDSGRNLVEQAMDNLNAGGSTAGGQGIKLAYKVAKENFKKGGVNRIILGTDGDFNVGVSDNATLTKIVKERAKEGTYISVLGFGSGNINDSMLESITNNGNGNYSYIDSVKEGRKVLLEDMMGTMVTIAKDVKVQVVMNPKQVKAYRLIGYSNRMLPPEAFLDKKVDAGEIGAGHSVTALYEIIPADGTPFGDQIDGSRYFEKVDKKPKQELKDSNELMFVKLAYKGPEQKVNDESTYVSVPFIDNNNKKQSADLQFSTAVALFGMVLRDSEHRGEGNLEMVRRLAEAGKGNDGKGQRSEFIKLVEQMQSRE